jgi:HSP20 family protein
MDKGVLSIKGERKAEAQGRGRALVAHERAHGVFYRRFALPDSANPDGNRRPPASTACWRSASRSARKASPRRINVQ